MRENLQKRVIRNVQGFIPITKWLPKYNFKKDIINDIIGGLTVGIMLVPQGMAYASLANLKPVNGLYTSFFAPLIYMFFGTSRHVALGVFAVVSLMSGSCNVRVTEELWDARNGSLGLIEEEEDEKYMLALQVSTGLTLLTGIIQISMAILRLDSLVSLLSNQIITGFTTGAAFHVFVAQLNKVIGVKLPRHSGPGKLFLTLHDLGSGIAAGYANYATIIISAFTITFLFCAKEFLDPKLKRFTKIPIPYDLFVMIAGTILSGAFDVNGKFGVKIIGDIPTGLPSPSLPDVFLFPYILKDAIAIAIVSLVVTISMGKLFAKKHNYEIDSRQEFYALGLTEGISSFFPVWPSATGLARTLVYEAAGTKSQLASLFSCGLLLAVILFIAPLVEVLPTCLLSCIIIVALKGMFMQLTSIPGIWAVSKMDCLVFIVTMVSTVVLDVVEGLLVGVLFSACLVLYRSQRSGVSPVLFEPKYIPNNGTTDVIDRLVLRIENSLFYMNSEEIKKQIYGFIDMRDEMRSMIVKTPGETPETEKCISPTEVYVVIDISKVNFIDYSGAASLYEVVKECKLKKIDVTYTMVSFVVMSVLKKHPNYDEKLFFDCQKEK